MQVFYFEMSRCLPPMMLIVGVAAFFAEGKYCIGEAEKKRKEDEIII